MSVMAVAPTDDSFMSVLREVAKRREWLVVTYEIEDWPPCWEAHHGLVFETDALLRWHRFAAGAESPAGEWFGWHEGLDRFRERVTAVGRRCAGGCIAPQA